MFYRFKRLLRGFQNGRFAHKPLIEVHINRAHLLHNLHEFQKRAPVMPVLKSNAYGHGLIPVAHILNGESIPFLVVDSYYEAHTLRTKGITTPILILGYTASETISTSTLSNTSFTIGSIAQLKELRSAPVSMHLKIDTGMHRQGIHPHELDQACSLLKKSTLHLEGICSHFSDADNNDVTCTKKQITLWNNIVARTRKIYPHIKTHIAATAGSFFSNTIDADYIRIGIGLFGITKNEQDTIDLKPVLSMHTVVSSVKHLPKGETVGYNNTFRAERDMTIATIPAGYFEGIDRRLSNKGVVRIGAHNTPIVGRVSMNITSIDVSNIPNVALNTPVTIISSDKNDPHSIENIAKTAETIPYVILIHIPQHLRRVVV